jgi:hypothetical protein
LVLTVSLDLVGLDDHGACGWDNDAFRHGEDIDREIELKIPLGEAIKVGG